MCLDPLLNKRVKANYQEHTNEDVNIEYRDNNNSFHSINSFLKRDSYRVKFSHKRTSAAIIASTEESDSDSSVYFSNSRDRERVRLLTAEDSLWLSAYILILSIIWEMIQQGWSTYNKPPNEFLQLHHLQFIICFVAPFFSSSLLSVVQSRFCLFDTHLAVGKYSTILFLTSLSLCVLSCLQDDTTVAVGNHSQDMQVRDGNVLNRVGHSQDKWKRQVREQRRNIYDRHTMLNWRSFEWGSASPILSLIHLSYCNC